MSRPQPNDLIDFCHRIESASDEEIFFILFEGYEDELIRTVLDLLQLSAKISATVRRIGAITGSHVTGETRRSICRRARHGDRWPNVIEAHSGEAGEIYSVSREALETYPRSAARADDGRTSHDEQE